jgi:hypothetical protein
MRGLCGDGIGERDDAAGSGSGGAGFGSGFFGLAGGGAGGAAVLAVVFVFPGTAAVLNFEEKLRILVNIAGEALFVEREEVEGFELARENVGLEEGMVDGSVFGFDVAGGEAFAEGEEVFLDCLDAMKAPIVEREGAGEIDFEQAVRVEGLHVFAGEGEVVDAVFVGHDGGLAGPGVLEAVHGGQGLGRDLLGFGHRFSPRLDVGMGVAGILGWGWGCC